MKAKTDKVKHNPVEETIALQRNSCYTSKYALRNRAGGIGEMYMRCELLIMNTEVITMRKKIMFRLTACMTAFMMVLGMYGTSSCAEDITQTEEFLSIIEERREEYLNSSEHMAEAAAKGITIEELLYQDALAAYPMRVRVNMDAKANDGISLLDVGNNGQNLSTNVKLIHQTSDHNCGPTSILQVLYGMGRQNAVEGATDEKKIEKLEEYCKPTSEDGTFVYVVVNCLNQYTTYANYRYLWGTEMTQAVFQSRLETSLYYNIAPILHARTEYLPYYGNHKSGHYIAVSEVDKANGTVRLSDCNWNYSYYGVHVVSVEEAYAAITKVSGRCLICMSY